MDKRLLSVEGYLANAHRQLWRATESAKEFRTDDLREDIDQILREIERVQGSLLKGRRPKPKSPAP